MAFDELKAYIKQKLDGNNIKTRRTAIMTKEGTTANITNLGFC
jgi:hypothetical protein